MLLQLSLKEMQYSMFVQQQSYSASSAGLRNPQNLDFPMKVKVFLEILIPHAVLMYIEQ
jgi:hypothetical protein